MATKHRFGCAVVIAATCLAVAAPAAQARPTGLVPGSHPGTWEQTPTTTSEPTAPIQVVVSGSDNGFDWVDGAVGAAVAATLLGVGGVATARVRPRRATTS